MKYIKLFENYNNITLELLTNNLTAINTKILLKLIKNSEYYDIFYMNFVINKHTQRRSEDLYKETGINNLVGDWKYPFSNNYLDNEFLLLTLKEMIKLNLCDKKEMIKLFRIYKNLNPIIKTIPTKNHYINMYHIMMGMTSGFNYDDIYDFIVIGGGSDRDSNYKKKFDIVCDLIGHHLYYIASEKTLDKIINNLKEREYEPHIK